MKLQNSKIVLWTSLLFTLAFVPSCKLFKNDTTLTKESEESEEKPKFKSKKEIADSFNRSGAKDIMNDPGLPANYAAEEAKRFGPISELVGDLPRLDVSKLDTLMNAKDLPADIDLRRFDSRVKDQGREGLCTAFATIGIMENLLRQNSKKIYLSERHLWSTYKQYSSSASVYAAKNNAIVAEQDWPYTYENRPNSLVGAKGLASIADILPTAANFEVIQRALERKHPLEIAVNTTSPFVNPRNGAVYVHTNESNSGHALAVVGIEYDRSAEGGGWFILKNSWGPNFGDNGYIYMPFAYCKYHGCWAWEIEGVKDYTGGGGGSNVPPSDDLAISVRYGDFIGGKKQFKLYLTGNSLSRVHSVRYHVHDTFGEYQYASASDPSRQFETVDYSTKYTDWTTQGAVVTYKDGQTKTIEKGAWVSWTQNSNTLPDPVLTLKAEYGTYNGSRMPFHLKLVGDSQSLDQVVEVTYDTHSTFPNQYQTSRDRSTNFRSPASWLTYARNWSTNRAVVTLKNGKQIKPAGVLISW